MIAVWRHELKMYFHSMTAYVFGAFLLLFTGIGALIYNINESVANFEYVLGFIDLVFIVIVPLLTMRIIAEEKRQKTDQLLYSLPISSAQVIIGKFLALLVVFAIPMVFICFYPLLFSKFGDVYLPTSYGSLVAFFFLGLALISIGMFISSLTESQGMAAGICVAVMLLLYFASKLADYVSASAILTLVVIIVVLFLLGMVIRALTRSTLAGFIPTGLLMVAAFVVYLKSPSSLEGLLPKVMDEISLFDRFDVFVNGVFDLTAIVYYISIIVFFLFLCVQSLEKRRYN